MSENTKWHSVVTINQTETGYEGIVHQYDEECWARINCYAVCDAPLGDSGYADAVTYTKNLAAQWTAEGRTS